MLVTDRALVDLPALVAGSFHPLMNNNPREVTEGELTELYREML